MRQMKHSELAYKQLLNRTNSSRVRVASAGKSGYAPFKLSPESELPYLAALCNEACLELNPLARLLYSEIIEVVRRPRIAEVFSKDFITDAECEGCQDFKELEGAISKYILKAFYHRDFEDRPRINPANIETWRLSWAISVTAGAESLGVTFAELDEKLKGDDYRVMQGKTRYISDRADRARRKRLKAVADKLGLNLVHEDSRYDLAKLWYVARVIKNNLTAASGLGEYEGHTLRVFNNAGTAHHQIHPFDIATGYTN